MPVVLTDYTNKTWAMEDPGDGLLHVGESGRSGPRLEDVLDFISTREKQFIQFITKKRMEKVAPKIKQRGSPSRQVEVPKQEVSAPQS